MFSQTIHFSKMDPEIDDVIFVHQLNSNVDMATYPHL
jgi:hypothetical protein